MQFIVYILRTSKNTLYTGQTNNLEKRLAAHRKKSKASAKYMRSFASFNLVYKENYQSKSEALKREWQLKKLTHEQKEELIKSSNESINI